jgi:DNA-binding NarL/FixJ family response regulator
MNQIKIVIIEDEDDIRTSLQMLLHGSDDIDLAEAFSDGETAVNYLLNHKVDVALFDINLPGISGIEAIARLKIKTPQMQFMVLTSYDDPDFIFKALRAGATGYILKSTPTNKLIDAIKELHNGGSPMSTQIARKVVTEFASFRPANTACEQLSRRENEILELMSGGLRYKEIAEQLFISTETVRTHIRNIYEKLQVNSRVAALKKAGIL